MAEQDVLVNVSEGIATVTINRPHAMNAMTTHVTATIISSLQELAQRDDVRVVVIQGAGDRAFCAGHDLKELAERSARGLGGDTERTAGSVIAIATFPKPTIAAVKGFVRGGGNWLATSCDMVVAAEDATFAMPQINFGAFEMVPMMPILRRVGRSKALDILLTADIIDAREAKAIGLVDRLLPVETFWPSVEELARKVASRDPQAVKAGKEALWLLLDSAFTRDVQAMKNALWVHHLTRKPSEMSGSVQRHLTEVRGSGSRR